MADQTLPIPFPLDTPMTWRWFRSEPEPEPESTVCPVQAHADALSEATEVLGGVLDAMTVRLASLRTQSNGSGHG
jgi:hypothetical protein